MPLLLGSRAANAAAAFPIGTAAAEATFFASVSAAVSVVADDVAVNNVGSATDASVVDF